MKALLVLLFVPGLAFADGAPSKPKKPTSLSYESVIKCFPELTDSTMEMRVDLAKLKQKIDSIFATDRTTLKLRIVRFRDSEGLRRLQLEQKTDPKNPLKGPYLDAKWETIEPNGTMTVWEAPHLKTRPTLMEVNNALAKGTIESDDRQDLDIKLKGMTVLTRRNLTKVVQIRFEDPANKKVLSCEDQADFGSICICKN